MTTRVDDRQLVWEPASSSYRPTFYARSLAKSVYVLVYNDPTWGVRFEPSPLEPSEWLGQFTEKTGGKSRAVERAQQHHDRQLRAAAWQKYMEEHDPPQEIQE